MVRTLTFSQAIREALFAAMDMDDSVICYGLGVDDPRGIFGTTLGLQERFGKERVFDMPTSENAMTGIAVGAALNGIRPIMIHQRMDFFLLALDQLVNNAAKWHYMFNGQASVPITIRLVVGRGWGQGPQHSQSLQALFSHIPGLKIVMPTSAADAKGLLLGSIFDDNPVVFIEHRWLHNLEGEVPEGHEPLPLGEAKVVRQGTDISIVSFSYMTVEAMHASEMLARYGISCEIVDLRTIKPLDWDAVLASVQKTGRLLALDTGPGTGSVASEIVARASMDCFAALRHAPQRIALPDYPTPTSPAVAERFYPRAEEIAATIGAMLGVEVDVGEFSSKRTCPHDVPGEWFKGPF